MIFKDLKVLELASVLAGPSVGQFFAELGAEVIKVENLKTGGDVTRSWRQAGEQTDDRSAYFCSCNWGKKSVAVDLTTEAGRQAVYELAIQSDVVIASYKPGDAEKLGVDFKQLKQNNPRLIYGQVSGYGPDDDKVGYDAVIQAESGFMYMNGEPGGPSLKMPVALIDVLAGHQLKEGLLIALLLRERTGQGTLVEVSLIQTALSSLANQATNYLINGKNPQKHGSAHPNIAPYGDVFVTSDKEELLLSVGNDKQFQGLCTILNDPSLAGNKDYGTNMNRVRNRAALNARLAILIEKQTSMELMLRLQKQKIPAGLIQNVQQALAMKQASELILSGGGVTGVRTFVGKVGEIALSKLATPLPPPHAGDHTGGFSN